ncbi:MULTISPECIES: NucA/NucB deoxyribonuclease domain-containing protein [Bacillus cereus group]|uniref:Sporulation protein n=1 Tax=Bacillus cereus TaxID=1396 RepID=A0A9X7B544_BACCE|nr:MULTISPECIES: NucA/NucB deoxyribonuclease domain-containing protein [Bacillus cereus group]PET91955.1 sporulation protein [Bacillus thuringiensis]PFU99185.1 sporulation protein [Bacillus cereus]PGK74979.1 sporulation protein [Bacillus thuringiensis]PGP58375.1 sporulation protein [Bacillus cereus]
MKFKGIIGGFLAVGLLFTGCSVIQNPNPAKQTSGSQDIAQVIEFPSNKYPETAAHIKDAIANGKTDICTIDRDRAAERRKQSLANVPTKKGYDRDEYPMAMCREGGKGADIRHIKPADNRGAGSYIGNKVEKLPDGAKVKIVVK